MDAPLPQKRAINIPDFRGVEGFISNSLRAEILSCPESLSKICLDASCYFLNHTEIWGCSYQAPITLKFLENDYFRIQLQQQGVGATQLGSQGVAITPDQGIISSGDATLSFGEGFVQKALRINRAQLVKKMAVLIDKPLIGDLEFEAPIDCKTEKFEAFTQMLGAIENLALLPDGTVPPFVFAELEQTLYSVILGSFKHNYTQILERPVLSAAPRHVWRVEEYIHAHWDQPITIEDIVAVAGCSARSIFRAFEKSRGYTPMEFVKRVRLQHAHEMLLAAQEKSVTRIALVCGFTDLGRFSRDYAVAYGELPSRTFRNALSRRVFLRECSATDCGV